MFTGITVFLLNFSLLISPSLFLNIFVYSRELIAHIFCLNTYANTYYLMRRVSPVYPISVCQIDRLNPFNDHYTTQNRRTGTEDEDQRNGASVQTPRCDEGQNAADEEAEREGSGELGPAQVVGGHVQEEQGARQTGVHTAGEQATWLAGPLFGRLKYVSEILILDSVFKYFGYIVTYISNNTLSLTM